MIDLYEAAELASLVPGVRVRDVVRFTAGDCGFLALAINRRAGWPLVAFEIAGGPADHVAVLAPSGMILDVCGLASRQTFRRRWRWAAGSAPLREYDRRTIRAFCGPPVFGRYTYERARILAALLVEHAEKG